VRGDRPRRPRDGATRDHRPCCRRGRDRGVLARVPALAGRTRPGRRAAGDLRGHARKDQHDALGAIIRQIFTAPDGDEARRRLGDAVSQLERRLPKVAALLEEAEDDVLAFFAFPAEHWPKLRSTNPLERFNREIGRRTDVVGIFPDDASLIRLVSMLAIEANDEWLVGRSYISLKSMALLYATRSEKTLPLKTEEEVTELITA
jgi:hypothetical protein